MISRILPKIISVGLVLATAVLLYASIPPATAQTPANSRRANAAAGLRIFQSARRADFPEEAVGRSRPLLRLPSDEPAGGGPLSLEMLTPGASFWTEEQSRRNFETVSKLVVPGNPSLSLFLRMPNGAGSGRTRRYSPGRQTICLRGRPGLEEHEGVGAWRKGGRFIGAVIDMVI